MAKLVFYITCAVLIGVWVAYYPAAAIVFWGIFSLFLFFLKKEEESLLFVVFFLPFSFALNPSPDIDLAANRLLIVALFAVWFGNSLVRKKINIPFKLPSLFLALFFLLAGFSVLVAANTDWAWRKILVFVSIFPLYLLVSDLCRGQAKAKRMIGALTISAVLVSGIGLVQFFSQFIFGIKPVFAFWTDYVAPNFYGANFSKTVIENPSWLVNIGGETYLRAISLFPDPHMFAFYLGLVLPIAVSLLLLALNEESLGGSSRPRGALKRNASFLFLATVILGLAAGLTYSRSGYIGIMAAGPVVIFLAWRFLASRLRAAISFLAVALLAAGLFAANPFSARLFSIADFREGSNASRIKIWQQAAAIIENAPLLGVGIGNYSPAIDPRVGYRNPIYAHNTYLDIAAETGIPAAITWFLLLALSFAQLWKKISGSAAGDDQSLVFVRIGLAGSLVSFMVSSLADTAIYSPAVLATLMVVLGLAVAIDSSAETA